MILLFNIFLGYNRVNKDVVVDVKFFFVGFFFIGVLNGGGNSFRKDKINVLSDSDKNVLSIL